MYMFYWTAEEVNERLERKMIKAYHEVFDASRKYNVTMRMGAYSVAVSRVAEAMKIRGWV